uniref:HAT C-terminal dimerisation domain-containing protein n=1 Tax=Chenopodium quinoa TaxID=63459 RepID=A0A803N5B6_CHEQI
MTMAREILAIPVSSVASESAFITGGPVLDSFRTSLSTKMVEGLVYGQDWMRSSNVPITIEESLLDLENMEEEGDFMT